MTKEEKKERLDKITCYIVVLAIVILVYFNFGFVLLRRLPGNIPLVTHFINFLWLNGLLIILKLEQISLRDNMIDPILIRRLTVILMAIIVAILFIILVFLGSVLLLNLHVIIV